LSVRIQCPLHEQAASDFGGPGTPSDGKRQSHVIDEEGMNKRWANERPAQSVWIELGSKSLIEGEVIGAPRKGVGSRAAAGEWVRLGAKGDLGGRE
jgi:hypothetical protein